MLKQNFDARVFQSRGHLLGNELTSGLRGISARIRPYGIGPNLLFSERLNKIDSRFLNPIHRLATRLHERFHAIVIGVGRIDFAGLGCLFETSEELIHGVGRFGNELPEFLVFDTLINRNIALRSLERNAQSRRLLDKHDLRAILGSGKRARLASKARPDNRDIGFDNLALWFFLVRLLRGGTRTSRQCKTSAKNCSARAERPTINSLHFPSSLYAAFDQPRSFMMPKMHEHLVARKE